MGKYVRRISYWGREIVFMDTPGAGEDAGIAAWEEMKQELSKQRDACLILVNATNITMAPGSVSKAKEAASTLRENPDNRIAFVGLTTLQQSTAQLLAKSLHVDAHFCKTVDEARDWLVKEPAGAGRTARR